MRAPVLALRGWPNEDARRLATLSQRLCSWAGKGATVVVSHRLGKSYNYKSPHLYLSNRLS